MKAALNTPVVAYMFSVRVRGADNARRRWVNGTVHRGGEAPFGCTCRCSHDTHSQRFGLYWAGARGSIKPVPTCHRLPRRASTATKAQHGMLLLPHEKRFLKCFLGGGAQPSVTRDGAQALESDKYVAAQVPVDLQPVQSMIHKRSHNRTSHHQRCLHLCCPLRLAGALGRPVEQWHPAAPRRRMCPPQEGPARAVCQCRPPSHEQEPGTPPEACRVACLGTSAPCRTCNQGGRSNTKNGSEGGVSQPCATG